MSKTFFNEFTFVESSDIKSVIAFSVFLTVFNKELVILLDLSFEILRSIFDRKVLIILSALS